MESASRWALDRLARFAVPGDPDMRPTLLRVLTELYVQKPTHTAEEERHYTELALRLLDAADISTRAAVSQRLAHYRSPPRRVVERLAGDIPNFNGQRQPCWHPGVTMLNRELTRETPIAIYVATTLNELFFAADSDERRLILLNLDVRRLKWAIGSRRFIPQSRGLRSTFGPGPAYFPRASAACSRG
jgi:hypothetical protein